MTVQSGLGARTLAARLMPGRHQKAREGELRLGLRFETWSLRLATSDP
ncbi:MAG TPA: hypothetical protein VFK54_03235 [Candidatus Limnocylindrales bacterium]|nr:hypothetical protein [Candidatus Limnocylindrales bacterium]